MSVDLESARGVVLDLAERAAELEEDLTGRILEGMRRFCFEGGTVPPPGHPYRSDFESWAESAGCGDGRRGFHAPKFHGRDGRLVGLWTVAQGKWVKSPTGKVWSGEPVVFEDWVAEDPERASRVADELALLAEVRAFGRNLPNDADLADGWVPPRWLALEQHEVAILDGTDPETGFPREVCDWLSRLVHEPKREYARAYCAHVLDGAPAPADPGADWAVKARKRADRVLAGVS